MGSQRTLTISKTKTMRRRGRESRQRFNALNTAVRSVRTRRAADGRPRETANARIKPAEADATNDPRSQVVDTPRECKRHTQEFHFGALHGATSTAIRRKPHGMPRSGARRRRPSSSAQGTPCAAEPRSHLAELQIPRHWRSSAAKNTDWPRLDSSPSGQDRFARRVGVFGRSGGRAIPRGGAIPAHLEVVFDALAALRALPHGDRS